MSKVKILKRSIKDDNLKTLFNQLLGSGDPAIIAKKNEEVRGCLRVIASVLRHFGKGPFRQFQDYTKWCDEFVNMATATEALLELKYEEIKDHYQTKSLILTCRELVPYGHCLQPPDLKDRWITNHPGLKFEPFSFTGLDVKHIWNNPAATANVKSYCLQTISVLFSKCNCLYNTISSPDIDVKKFSHVIVNAIDKVKDQPVLSRCSDAFNKIRESVDLLENNFGEYYKDMVQSENPNTIIENFIVDVSQGSNMNFKLMRQFRIIINFYHKQSRGQVQDPKVKAMFNKLNSRINMLEKQCAPTGAAAAAGADADEDDLKIDTDDDDNSGSSSDTEDGGSDTDTDVKSEDTN